MTNVLIYSAVQLNLDIMKGQGLAKFVRYNEVLFHIFCYYWGKTRTSLYYIGVPYNKVQL